jgi:ABC transport system ATP-binding/permease protein
MVLTGAMFSFDKINRSIGGGSEKVPVIAEIMPTRWGFEAMVVNQFINNEYTSQFYNDRKLESIFNYKNVYYIPEIRSIVDNYKFRVMSNDSIPVSRNNLELLFNELKKENNSEFTRHHNIRFNHLDKINHESFNMAIADSVIIYLTRVQDFYRENFNHVNDRIDQKISSMISTPEKRVAYQKLYDDHYNTYLGRFAQNALAPLPLVRLGNRFVQKIDPVFLDPQDRRLLSFRSHFLAPNKNLLGNLMPTFYFNLMVIWIFTVFAYIFLYYNGLTRVINLLNIAGPRLNERVSGIKSIFQRKPSPQKISQ